MSARLVNDHGYVLHARPYRESSALVDLFTERHGRVSAVARGVRGTSKRVRAVQLFVACSFTWSGGGELRNLRSWESQDARWLTGDALAAGMYLNELLVRLLAREDPHEVLFAAYASALSCLQSATLALVLREFERTLLDELGYGVSFGHSCGDGQDIDPARHYQMFEHQGFIEDPNGEYAGATLLAIGTSDFATPLARRAAKRIFRELLAAHLGTRPLLSPQMLVHSPLLSESQGDADGP